ncbi:MAG TPA: galactose-1-phosphate uridylyltransferase, partial [Planctomycetota bacterium]|nr:galactose-1-phosphate uridylyltransferase [Planctomycetota bacterium]
PVLGRWVIIATDRGRRPQDFRAEAQPAAAKACPFCEGQEASTAPEIQAFRARDSRPNGPGWRVRTVPNRHPALQVEGDLDKRGDGIYDLMNGIGAHEVIIETPRHAASITELDPGHVQDVLWMYRDRMVDLKRDRRLVYGLIFKNVGLAAGASLAHTHSQLICTPTVPKTVSEEMRRTSDYFDFRGRCLFCDMVRQELGTYARVVKETASFLAFAPFAARFPFETWILPKRHVSHFEYSQRHEIEELADCLRATLVKLERALDRPPYNYLIHSSPFDRQDVESYHWHIEIIPRLIPIAGFEWGTDFYVNPVPPEKAAEYLRSMEVPGS